MKHSIKLACLAVAVLVTAGLCFVFLTTQAQSAQASFSAHDAFLDKCAACHARDGSGKTIKGRKDHVKDVRQTIKKLSEAQMIQIVEKGKGAYMNSFSKQYSPQQIKELVEYYRSLASQ